MKKFEKIIGFVLLTGLIFKFLFIPGGSFFFAFSSLIMATFYFYLGFAFYNQIPFKRIFNKAAYSEINTAKIILSIGFGIGLSNICIGILYKIQHWTGARFLLITGITIIMIVLLIGLIRIDKTKGLFLTGIIKRSIIIGGFGVLLLLISDHSIIKIQYRNHPLYIKAYEDFKSNPNNTGYKDNLIKERDRIYLPEEVFKQKYNEEEENTVLN